MSARKLLVGFCQVDDPSRIPADCFTFFAPVPGWEGWTADKVQGRPMVMQIPVNAQVVTSVAVFDAYLEQIKQFCITAGVTPAAMSFSEEWYGSSHIDALPLWGTKTGMALKDAKKGIVNLALQRMKQVWPLALTVQIENFFNDDTSLGDAYYMPAYDCDILALDAFYSGPGDQHYGTAGMPLNGEAGYSKFKLEVEQFYERAAGYNKPLMMIPQAFTWQGATPTPEQLRWYYLLADRTPQVVAVAYFGRYTWAGNGDMLDRHPSLLAEVQWQYEQWGGTGVI